MPPVHRSASPRQRLLLAASLAAVVAIVPRPAAAQFGGGGFGNQAVGGISVDAKGIVGNLDPKAAEELAVERRRALADGNWTGKAGDSRKVSLKAVAAAVASATAKSATVPAEAMYLGGLQRIDHVFVDPDAGDIVLTGPADTLVVDQAGNVVGASTGRPPLMLEDLVVALRAIDAAKNGGMTCSIDPTPEGIANLQTLLARQATMANPQATFTAMEQALGPQKVTVSGVPTDSRFARVLVAADYRMKRIGMGHEPSGLQKLPSYLAMVPAGGRAMATPRFWLEAEYDPIARDPDELAWKIGGRRMKCLTESDAFGDDGVKRGGGAADATARRWCEAMTANYDALAAKHPVFADLANCVDLAVVAALIRGRQLDAKAGCDLAPLLDASAVPLPKYDVPETVPTVATGVKKGSAWVLSASGGVTFQPWQFAAATAESQEAAAGRHEAIAARPAGMAGCSWD
jgi:hypothetical protein